MKKMFSLVITSFLKITVSFLLVFSIFQLLEISLLLKNSNNFGCHHCQIDSELGWRSIPDYITTKNQIRIKTNSLGFRSEEINQSKEHILILGDSVAFGNGVNDNETVSYFIQKKTAKYQVLNLAVPGYSIDQYYLTLKNNINKTNPKYIIVILFSGNDWFQTIQDNLWGTSKPFFKMENGELIKKNSKISMFSCSNYLNKNRFFNKFNQEFLTRFFCNTKKHNSIEGKKVIGLLLEKIKDLGEITRAKTFFVLSPTINDFFIQTCGQNTNFSYCESNMKKHPEFYFNNLTLFQKHLLDKKNMRAKKKHSLVEMNIDKGGSWAWYLRFRMLLEERKFKFLDFQDELMKQNENIFEIYLKDDDFHYSPKGNRVLANTISRSLNFRK